MPRVTRRLNFALLIIMLVLGSSAGCVRSKPPVARAPLPGAGTPLIGINVGDQTSEAKNATPAATATPLPAIAYPQPATATLAPTLPPTATPMATAIEAMTAAPTVEPVATDMPTATEIPALPMPTMTMSYTVPIGVPGAEATPTVIISGDITYIVQAGDSLYSIAQAHHTTVPGILTKNPGLNPYAVSLGQTIVVPVGYVPEGSTEVVTVTHVVRQGENLFMIARRYQTSVADIMRLNPGIGNPNFVAPGTSLTIEVGSAPPVILHTVRYGETISGIASRYGVSVAALVQANSLRNPNRLYAGQVLVIPR